MSETQPSWIEANNQYLALSLTWLRARLRARIAAPPPIVAPSGVGDGLAERRMRWGIRPRQEPSATVVAGPLVVVDGVPEEQTAAAARAEAAAIDPPPALITLAARLGLTDFERDTLLLCVAPELEPAISDLFGAAPGQGAGAAPSFALALHVLDDASWDALSPHRPLRYARLIDVGQTGTTPLTAAPLRADERIVHYLKGLNALDARLADVLTPAGDAGESPQLAPSQKAVAETILVQLRAAGSAAQIPLIGLVGNDVGSQVDTAREVAAAIGRRLYQIDIDALPLAAELEGIVRLWQRERLLLPIALFIDAHELSALAVDRARAFHAFIASDIGPAFVGLREMPGRALGRITAFEVGKPTAREQRDAWAEALGAEDDLAPRLASQFDLSLRDIAAALTFATAACGGPPDAPAIWSAARRLVLPRLDQLAQRIDPRATWDDIVLTDEARSLLAQVAEQARHRYQVYEEWGFAARMNRGLGISALFAGESGTGKTMAAEVIANALGVALYRIDLSAVVSKYIGETEKNLSRMFDAAEQGGAILLFDEADALFGKRSEVKDSHDRYANIEINYLLQRMESFRGLAILATNMKSALDAAFLRRLRFVVNFPYPGPAEREQMWRKAMPEALPRDEIDYGRLARFSLSGGNIHSVALNAAFLASSRGVPLNQELVLSAVRNELKKLDRPANEAALR